MDTNSTSMTTVPSSEQLSRDGSVCEYTNLNDALNCNYNTTTYIVIYDGNNGRLVVQESV